MINGMVNSIDNEIKARKRFLAAGYAIFAVAAGLLLSRVGAYFLGDIIYDSSLSDVMKDFWYNGIFTLFTQLVVCLGIPFIIYKVYQGIGVKEILANSNYKKVNPQTVLMSLLLGVVVVVFTLMVSNLWRVIIILLGYNYPTSGMAMPETFSPAIFIGEMILTAVLPAICEEFAIRGTFLTSMRHRYLGGALVVLMALVFGLFHQSILQVLYTALSGGLMAFLVIKTGSLFPAMIVHFVNNAMSVFIDHAVHYGWGNDFINRIFMNIDSFAKILLVLFLSAGIIFLIVRGIIKQNKGKELKTETLYKPSRRESAFYIGALVLTITTTVLSFAFGS